MLKEADKKERNLSRIYRLPLDHLVEREEPDHLNLPLLAFSYLLRRLSVCYTYPYDDFRVVNFACF